MKKIIFISLFLFFTAGSLSAGYEEIQDDALSLLSEEDAGIIQNLELLENLETLEGITEEGFDLLENLEFIDDITENLEILDSITEGVELIDNIKQGFDLIGNITGNNN